MDSEYIYQYKCPFCGKGTKFKVFLPYQLYDIFPDTFKLANACNTLDIPINILQFNCGHLCSWNKIQIDEENRLIKHIDFKDVPVNLFELHKTIIKSMRRNK